MELVNQILIKFPSLYEMLPGEKYFDISNWPISGQLPNKNFLKNAKNVRSRLYEGDDRFFMIAGTGRKTVVEAQLSNDKKSFDYTYSEQGDGTVPLKLAKLSSAKMYYVEEDHGSLPNNGSVIKAVREILKTGTTAQLASTPPDSRSRAEEKLSDVKIRSQIDKVLPNINGKPKDAEKVLKTLDTSYMRSLMNEFASISKDKSTVLEQESHDIFSQPKLTFGRGNSPRLISHLRRQIYVDVVKGNIIDVNASVYVLGLFEGVSIKGGALGAVDRALNGNISRTRELGMLTGQAGDLDFIPTPSRSIRSDQVVLVGMGGVHDFSSQPEEVIEKVASRTLQTLVACGITDLASVLIGQSVSPPHKYKEMIRGMLKGIFKTLQTADTDSIFNKIQLCALNEDICSELSRLIAEVAPELTGEYDFDIVLNEVVKSDSVRNDRSLRNKAPNNTRPDILSIKGNCKVAGVKDVCSQAELSTFLLGNGGGASTFESSKNVNFVDIEELLEEVESLSGGNEKASMLKLGKRLGGLCMSETVLDQMSDMEPPQLLVLNNAVSSRIPWELLTLKDDRQLSLEWGLSRRFVSRGTPSKISTSMRNEYMKTLRLLLIYDPTRDLPGAVKEGERLLDLFHNHPIVKIEMALNGAQATRDRIWEELTSGKYDIVHYAGHADFDQADRSDSGIVCFDKKITGRELIQAPKLPTIAVFNACESARVRGQKKDTSLTMRQKVDRNIGFAEAFFLAGVQHYIGTYWPVRDAAAEKFPKTFYEELSKGSSIGFAVSEARKAVAAHDERDWANYIHYGDPEFVLEGL